MNEETFIDGLRFPEWKEKYQKEKKKINDDITRTFEDTKERRINRLKNGIEDDRLHREMVNVCVYPFTEKGSLKDTHFQYIRQSPLHELNVPNFDFLLFRQNERSKIAILGECKGSVMNSTDVINDLKRKREVLHDPVKLNYLKEKYLKIPIETEIMVEYVIAVPLNESFHVLNKVIENQEPIITWGIPTTGEAIITLASPPDSIPNRHNYLHKLPELNQKIQNAISNRKAFNVFLGAHICSRLYSLVVAAQLGEEGLVIEKDTLRDNISMDLLNVDNEIIQRELDFIIQKGIEIGIIAPTLIPNRYRLISRGTKREIVAQTLEKKWIDAKIRKELEKDKENAIQELQSKIHELIQKDKSKLDTWTK
jgi:hypothetical protein